MTTAQTSLRRCIVHPVPALCIWLLLLQLFPIPHAFSTPPLKRLTIPKWATKLILQEYNAQLLSAPLNLSSENEIYTENTRSSGLLTHSDIDWRLRPPEGTSLLDRFKLKIGANILRLDSKLKGRSLPPVLCPKGGRAVLEAYYKEPGKRKKKIARFGITTARGPSCNEIDTTIRELYKINPQPLSVAIGAIVYMFVEPGYRKLGIGSLALEVISAIHYVQAVDFTVLVADDDGSGGLVRWYENNGYSRAPLMQNVLGSPDGKYGVAMICPVSVRNDFFQQCRVKWW
ncbi:hypothetical protein ACHAW6_013842 [Cyclotella cf. meneghiniana]